MVAWMWEWDIILIEGMCREGASPGTPVSMLGSQPCMEGVD